LTLPGTSSATALTSFPRTAKSIDFASLAERPQASDQSGSGFIMGARNATKRRAAAAQALALPKKKATGHDSRHRLLNSDRYQLEGQA
jgi:hypothetical protein